MIVKLFVSKYCPYCKIAEKELKEKQREMNFRLEIYDISDMSSIGAISEAIYYDVDKVPTAVFISEDKKEKKIGLTEIVKEIKRWQE